MANQGIVKGSIMDVSKGDDPASALMDARMLLICDLSSSMSDADSSGIPRYVVENEVVRNIQERHPGMVALLAFNDTAIFALDGELPMPFGGTNMAYAMTLAKTLADSGLKATLISDGEPNPGQEGEILTVAKQMKGKLHTIFVGEEGSKGERFLKEVAKAAGGTHQSNEATRMLDTMIELLLLKAG